MGELLKKMEHVYGRAAQIGHRNLCVNSQQTGERVFDLN